MNAVLGTLTALAVVAAATFLGYEHVIDGQATVGLFATLIGGGGAVVAHQTARGK